MPMTEEKRAEVRRLRDEEGMTFEKIARATGASISGCRYVCATEEQRSRRRSRALRYQQEHRGEPKPPKWPEWTPYARELRDRKFSWPSIARLCSLRFKKKISDDSVRYWVLEKLRDVHLKKSKERNRRVAEELRGSQNVQ